MKLSVFLLFTASFANAQAPCVVESSRAEFHIAHVHGNPKLTLDENAAIWKHAAAQKMWKDCSRQIEYPETTTTIKGFWTDTDLYLFFRCPYKELNLFLPANHAGPRVVFGTATSSKCSLVTIGKTSATIANSKSRLLAIGSILLSISINKTTTTIGAPVGKPLRGLMKRTNLVRRRSHSA